MRRYEWWQWHSDDRFFWFGETVKIRTHLGPVVMVQAYGVHVGELFFGSLRRSR